MSLLKEENIAKIFCLNLTLLIMTGVIMVYSSSYLFAKESFGSSSYFFIKQLIHGLSGLFLVLILSKTPFLFWYKYRNILGILCVILMLLTFIPSLGYEIKGARRWINLFGYSFQPGEFFKYILIFPAIYFFDNFTHLSIYKKIFYLLLLLIPLGSFIFQPDFGSFSICLLIIVFICFMSSFPRKYFYGLIVLAPTVGVLLLSVASYRVQRILTFLDPWKDPQKSGFQIIQSYLAFANGSIFGKGIGNSNEKLFYLPEAHNDFIFSVIGEEWGLLGVLFIVLAFFAFVLIGLKMAIFSKQRIPMIFMVSVIFTLGIQAFLNMGVVLGLLPTKGLNLPFISYGGSSMLSNCMAIGLLLSAKNSGNEHSKGFFATILPFKSIS